MDSSKSIRTYKDAVAIVTGGASGIGQAISEELVKRGCEVVIADRQIDVAEEIASKLCLSGGKATARELDVINSSAVEALVNDTVQRTGRLDYMFNNAGIIVGGPAHMFWIDDWNEIVNVNLNGVINGVQAAYKTMVVQGFGHIVNTASMAGLIPISGSVAYAATKHAVVGLSESLRAEAALFGIRVSVLCPGFIRTPILDGGKFGRILLEMPPEVRSRSIERFKPEQPAALAEKALDLVAKNKAIIIEPSWYKIVWWIYRLCPSFSIGIAQKHFRDMARIALAKDRAGQP